MQNLRKILESFPQVKEPEKEAIYCKKLRNTVKERKERKFNSEKQCVSSSSCCGNVGNSVKSFPSEASFPQELKKG
jgi:hypothetical protein